jgi:hypothetical protein
VRSTRGSLAISDRYGRIGGSQGVIAKRRVRMQLLANLVVVGVRPSAQARSVSVENATKEETMQSLSEDDGAGYSWPAPIPLSHARQERRVR